MALKLTDSSPNPEEFRIAASDTKGHSARQWFRVIPAMARQIEQVVQSRRFPYRTGGDVLRHAIHRHMKWLTEIDPVLSISGQVNVILEIMRDDEMNADFTLVFDKLGERIAKHLESNSQREAMRLVLTIQEHINGMPEGFWKTRYKEEVKKKYGPLLKNAEKADLRLVYDS